jgi:hypothetical protein
MYFLEALGAPLDFGWVARMVLIARSLTWLAIGTSRISSRTRMTAVAVILLSSDTGSFERLRSTIKESAANSGNSTSVLKKNRSSWASGSG